MERFKGFVQLVFAPVVAFVVAGLSGDDVLGYLATVTGVATLAPMVVEPLKQWVGTSGWGTRWLSAGVVYVLIIGSCWLGFGLQNYLWFEMLVAGALVTLTTWGVVSIEHVKVLLKIVFGIEKPK